MSAVSPEKVPPLLLHPPTFFIEEIFFGA